MFELWETIKELMTGHFVHGSWKLTSTNMSDCISNVAYLFIITIERHTLQCKPFFGKLTIQYKCHDMYYYIHIDHWFRDSVGEACSVLQSSAFHWQLRVGRGNEKTMIMNHDENRKHKWTNATDIWMSLTTGNEESSQCVGSQSLGHKCIKHVTETDTDSFIHIVDQITIIKILNSVKQGMGC